jgi:hypothetical protein
VLIDIKSTPKAFKTKTPLNLWQSSSGLPKVARSRLFSHPPTDKDYQQADFVDPRILLGKNYLWQTFKDCQRLSGGEGFFVYF